MEILKLWFVRQSCCSVLNVVVVVVAAWKTTADDEVEVAEVRLRRERRRPDWTT